MANATGDASKSGYIAYINIAKALAIFLVCYYHFSTTGDIGWSNSMSVESVIGRVVYNIAAACVPLFFMCTGALLLNSSRFDHLKNLKRAGAAYLQFVAWAAISILLIGAYNGVLREINFKDVIGVFLGATNISRGDVNLVALGHLWFIPAYIGVVLLVPFLRTVLADAKQGWMSYLALIAVIVVSIHVMNTLRIAFPYSAAFNSMDPTLPAFTPFIHLGGAMTVYAIIGGLAHRYRDAVRKQIPLYIWFVTLAVGITIGFWEWKTKVTGPEPEYDYVFEAYTTLSGFLMAISIFMMLLTCIHDDANPRGLRFWWDLVATNTLVIYYVHFILGATVQMEFMDKVPMPSNLLINTIRALLLIGFSVGIGAILKRYRYTRFLTGGS